MATQEVVAPYDLVGQYNQDEINGFDDRLLERLLNACALQNARTVLDAMAGDGNLSRRLFHYCQRQGVKLPAVTVLEFSKVQSEIAARSLAHYPAEVIWGDIVRMQSLTNNRPLPQRAFDRVLIKSANHEIPLALQEQLYRNVYEALTPEGLFVNLGFLFDDEQERDELREIARVKDSLAGHQMAVENRHFLTRTEFYERLRRAGFVDIQVAHAFSYLIRSEIVAERYFKTEVVEQDTIEFQIAQLRAKTMRRKGRIRFEADATMMECPGEITIARRPSLLEENRQTYVRYPYEFLRSIQAHRDMLTKAAAFVQDEDVVLDAGCGIGLFAERVAAKTKHYMAIDAHPQSIEACRRNTSHWPQVETQVENLNNVNLARECFDCIVSLNVLYQEGIEPEKVIQKLRDALRPGGSLVLTCPRSRESFQRCEARLIAELEREGMLQGKEEIVAQIRAANERLLSPHAHYWSAKEMAGLLLGNSFSSIKEVDESLYHGEAWLIAATR